MGLVAALEPSWAAGRQWERRRQGRPRCMSGLGQGHAGCRGSSWQGAGRGRPCLWPLSQGLSKEMGVMSPQAHPLCLGCCTAGRGLPPAAPTKLVGTSHRSAWRPDLTSPGWTPQRRLTANPRPRPRDCFLRALETGCPGASAPPPAHSAPHPAPLPAPSASSPRPRPRPAQFR